MTDPLLLVHALARSLEQLAGGQANAWFLRSYVGADLVAGAGAPVRFADLPGFRELGDGLLRRIDFGAACLLLLLRDPPVARDERLDDALLVVASGQARLRGVLVVMAGASITGDRGLPTCRPIGDWIRLGEEDPLRALPLHQLGARFPDLRGLARGTAQGVAGAWAAAHRFGPAATAILRRGPSSATSAELEAFARIGGEIVVEQGCAEVIAARQQGLPCLPLALVLDDARAEPAADPGQLAEAAAALLPRVARALPDLVARLAAGPAEAGAT